MLLRVWLLACFVLAALVLGAQTEPDDSLQHKIYYYEGGAKSSEGTLRNGKPDGYWKSYYRNGNLKSEGNRDDFKLDSTWKFYTEDGNLNFTVEYDDGQKDGLRKTYKEGNLVKSETYHNDTLNGPTKFFYRSGEMKKQVFYEDGKPVGKGFEYAKDGRIITMLTYKNGVLARQQKINRLDKQQQKQGLWVEFYNNMSVKVEGTYVNNLKNGYWKYYDKKGNLLRIEKWVRGELQEGASETAKVDIRREINPQTGELEFKGAYKNGKPSGVHRYYGEDGKVDSSKIYENGTLLFEGIVDEEGQKQGPWKEYYRSGELKAEGRYRDNKKVGTWKYYYRNGNLEQTGSYIAGLPDGTWEWYYPDQSLLREEEYVMGDEEGKSIEYSDTGTVIAEGEYVGGLKEGEWMYVVNDHKEVGTYFEGKRNGLWKHYYLSNGKLRFEGRYENGVENGVHTYYYPSGELKKRGEYSFGIKDGIWEYYDKNGNRIITIEYEDGREIKYNGKKISYGRRVDRELEREREQEEQE